MKIKKILSVVCTLLFLAGIVSTLFGYMNPDVRIFTWSLLAVSIIYLFTGLLLFRGYYPEGHPLNHFFIGYLYSGVFIAFTFFIAGWPLAKMLISFCPVWMAVLFTIIMINQRKISKEGFIQFIIEGSIMLLLAIFLLIKM
jgi:hypothetical protein